MARIPVDVLDRILALQFVVAWAGEGCCEPQRLGWWQTDLVDEAGGACILTELLPRTFRWAALEAVRAAAIEVDQECRSQLTQAEQVRTLFFWGFDIDEQLADRLRDHKLKSPQTCPEEILDIPMLLTDSYSEDTFRAAIGGATSTPLYEVVPRGRELNSPPVDYASKAQDLAQDLAAALLPLVRDYPMPFYRLTSAQ